MKNKKATKIIKNWQIHTLSFTQEDINKVYPGENLQPLIVTGTVVEDKSGKFKPGYHMRSSLIKEINKEKKEIETKNTVYKLEGEEGTDIFSDLGNAVLNVFY